MIGVLGIPRVQTIGPRAIDSCGVRHEDDSVGSSLLHLLPRSTQLRRHSASAEFRHQCFE